MKALFSRKSEKLIVNGKLEPDGMKLFIDVEKISEEPFTKQDIIDLIKDSVKMDLIDMDVINDIVLHLNDPKNEEVETKDRRIAKGKPAETGADGKLLLLIKALTGEVELLQPEEGAEEGETQAIVNYRDIHLFDNVEAGKVVARIYEPKTGSDGYDALGKVLPGKKGNPLKISLDKTLTSRAAAEGAGEYTEIVAQSEGYLLSESGRLSVQPELIIKGDLDYHAGNLDFVGSIKVLGDVMPNFRVTARKSIEIRGMVRGENILVARNGDVTVSGYIYGGPESKVMASGSFFATVLQEVNAEARGDMTIKKESVDSILRVGGALLLPEGSLMGGVAHVVRGVEAKRIGNEAGQPTHIVLCNSVEATMDYEQIVRQIDEHEHAVEIIKSHLGPLLSNPDRIQFLNQPLRSKMEALLGKLKNVVRSREELQRKRQEMLLKSTNDLVLKVNFRKKLYPGVIVMVGKNRLEIKDEKDGPGSIEFVSAQGEFVDAEYKEITATAVVTKEKGRK